MKNIMKRAAVICMAFIMTLTMMPLLGVVTEGSFGTPASYAESQADVTVNGVKFHLWYGETGASVAVRGYSGTATEIELPSAVTYGGNTYKADSGAHENWFFIEETAFAGNTSIKKIAIPDGYGAISGGAFAGCTGLTEVSIGSFSEPEYGGIGSGAFTGCTNLKTYNIDSSGMDAAYANDNSMLETLQNQIINAGIGTDANGNPIAGVTVYTQKGSVVWNAIVELNKTRPADKQIKLVDSSDPYGRNTISGGSGGSGGDPDSQMGEDGTAYGKGASETVMDKAITKYSKEKDPKGSVFGLLKARITKTTTKSLTLQWDKVSGAKKYIIYGSQCGSKYKMVRQKVVKASKKSKVVFKKVSKKKVKKGKPYKFIVVAIDKNGKVISTSKMVHAATKGGKKWVNAKKVTTKAKKNKVKIRKGKTFKLKAKAIPEKGKGKMIDHRKIVYETSNPKVATVSKKGVIKGVGKGKCTVYVYAHNGIYKAIKVTVN